MPRARHPLLRSALILLGIAIGASGCRGAVSDAEVPADAARRGLLKRADLPGRGWQSEQSAIECPIAADRRQDMPSRASSRAYLRTSAALTRAEVVASAACVFTSVDTAHSYLQGLASEPARKAILDGFTRSLQAEAGPGFRTEDESIAKLQVQAGGDEHHALQADVRMRDTGRQVVTYTRTHWVFVRERRTLVALIMNRIGEKPGLPDERLRDRLVRTLVARADAIE